MLYAPSYDDGSSIRIARVSGTVSMDSVCGGAESEKRMIITCPHCHAALDIADKQIGERVHHARCNNWSMVGQHADGSPARVVGRSKRTGRSCTHEGR